MKPMNRMEAFLMGDKKLAPETRQEAVRSMLAVN